MGDVKPELQHTVKGTGSSSRFTGWRLWLIPGIPVGMAIIAGIWNLASPPTPRSTPLRYDAKVAMVAIHTALQKYKADYGSFPTGDSHAISRALLGDNPEKLAYISITKSTNGDMIDPWETPYLIYFAGEAVLVRSAGPNGRFESSDVKGFDDLIE